MKVKSKKRRNHVCGHYFGNTYFSISSSPLFLFKKLPCFSLYSQVASVAIIPVLIKSSILLALIAVLTVAAIGRHN